MLLMSCPEKNLFLLLIHHAAIIAADMLQPTAVSKEAEGKLYLSVMEWNFKRLSSPVHSEKILYLTHYLTLTLLIEW